MDIDRLEALHSAASSSQFFVMTTPYMRELHEALPELLRIARAVRDAPVGRVETDGCADDGMPMIALAADSTKAERAIKRMHMQRVRLVVDGGPHGE